MRVRVHEIIAGMKWMLAIALVTILGSLGLAGVFMLKKSRSSDTSQRKMAWALALRVALSILLFVGILLAWALGYLQPSGIPLRN